MAQNRLSNTAGINLAAAVWLADDDYDYVDKPNYLSVTTVIKPVRQIILGGRVPVEERITDLTELVQSRIGQSLHKAVETAWTERYKNSLLRLGHPARMVESIEVNPTMPDPDKIQVYAEQRREREFLGFSIGGKFDLCIDGRLQDVKKTSVWSYQAMKGISDDKWRLQGSLYRWLNPDKVKHDKMYIQYILLDWIRSMIKRDPNYPPHAVPHRVVDLYSLAETESWLRRQLTELKRCWDLPEDQLPFCEDTDLWRSDPVYKYYANLSPGDPVPPGTRSTKNFTSLGDAMQYRATKGKGVVLKKAGTVQACNYCPAASICSQRMMLEAAGELDI